MRILQILPGFEEGGVERHVLWLSNELARRGHEITVLSSGGKLEASLKNVEHWVLPVQRKNLFTGIYCAIRIALRAKKENWQIFHSHSRVPSWITWWGSCMTGIPWIVSCHAKYSHNIGLKPYNKANVAICVSKSVKEHLSSFLPMRNYVIYNGLLPAPFLWEGQDNDASPARLLFIGRLTEIKGIHDIVEILPKLKGCWRLDILGEGPLMDHLKDRVARLDQEERVKFHGFRDDTDEWLKKCSCLLFPSHQEGMPLTLARAIQLRVPVIASNIPPVRELAFSENGLLEPGSKEEWKEALNKFVSNRVSLTSFDISAIPSVHEMSEKVEDIYLTLTNPGT